MSASQEKNDDSRNASQELIHLKNSYQNLIKRTLISSLLRTLSQRILDGAVYMSKEDFLLFINYFHYLGGSSSQPPALGKDFSQGYANDIFDRISEYGSSISDSGDSFINGLNSLRDFVSKQFPYVSTILANIKEDIRSREGIFLLSEDGSLEEDGILVFSALFRGIPENINGYYSYFEMKNITQILPLNVLPNDPCCDQSLPDDKKQCSMALRAISDLYYSVL